jgi:Zn-dependent protease
MNIQTLLLLAPPILLALTFHEYAHAFMANMYGDDTAKQSGRLMSVDSLIDENAVITNDGMIR